LIRAKKSLGQHFLHEQSYAQRIALAINPDARRVTEIGPGTGMLTQFLIGRFDELLLLEKDTELCASLSARWHAYPGVTILEADALSFDYRGFWGDRSFSLVGNFPYNISSQIVFTMLSLCDQIPEMVGMFQYEMARRIISGPGSKDYGIISVLTSAMYSGRMLFRVPSGAFNPPPKVESAVIRLERKHDYSLPCAFSSLQKVVRAAFGQRRKMLRNSLKSLVPNETLLSSTLFQKRPEHLALGDFIDIALEYESLQQSDR